MIFKACLLLLISAFCYAEQVFAQLVEVEKFGPRRADTLILEKNWRTQNNIIISELEFSAGDTVTAENLNLSLKKIWNLQNFATVTYRWDSLPDGRAALVLIARDALTIRPIVGGWKGMSGVSALKLGVDDHNFLGRNILFEIRAQVSLDDPIMGEVKFMIPRQLLWKNMSVGAGYKAWMIYRDEGFEQISINLVNPFHEDFRNRFAPDVEIGGLRNVSIPPSDLIFDTLPTQNHQYDRRFGYARISESFGTITHRRHQEEGYLITGMLGASAGLNSESKNYREGSLKAEYHKMINQRMQFSAKWAGYYSSSECSSLWTRFGPSDIRGTYYGDISGRVMHLASTGLYYTWLNRDYLAVEQSVFVQYAAAMTSVGDWKSVMRHYAIGTGFQFTIPMFPAASILIAISYNPNRRNWYYLEL